MAHIARHDVIIREEEDAGENPVGEKRVLLVPKFNFDSDLGKWIVD